ncbi:hypothetical protein BDY21DRAFT_155652 [Lineolata rhizophorae]|uniref:Zn(2)-C6 fungal-type domain-containing protein n=1 Tax=Lineolata rhizophorae TaxID=578093 RepID=A0A6A6NMY2_9PEZI|nr:hypothetical protein BDY21DRAFT_155652 [Lineolata rhizophorae]
MARLGHSKSRTGCLRCKQRRVKCDENSPCAACARHGVRCSLLEPLPGARKSSSAKQSTQRSKILKSPADAGEYQTDRYQRQIHALAPAAPASTNTFTASSRSSTSVSSDLEPFPYFEKFLSGQELKNASTWITDLELMHHYTASTFLTLPRGNELPKIWQTEVPRLALAHPFLMHHVLAISAYHLASLYPDRRSLYSVQASQHQNDAIKGLRTSLSQINEGTCHALFAASFILSISAFAIFSDHKKPDSQPTIDDLLDVFLLIRGMSGIIQTYEETIRQGPLEKLFLFGDHESRTPLLATIVDRLGQLKIPENVEPATRNLCHDGSFKLIEWIAHASANADVPEPRVSITWPIGLSEGFINLLRGRHPAALTVLAYYCVILHSTGSAHWFMQGWGECILRDIAESVERPWSEALKWPMKSVGGEATLVQ